MPASQREVLALYRRLLRLSRTWMATEPKDTTSERSYIKEETMELFRQNRHVAAEEEIKQHLHEAEARVELALHYRIPYPRPVNIPQNVLPPTSRRRMKGREKAIKQSYPVYMKSYMKDDKEGE